MKKVKRLENSVFSARRNSASPTGYLYFTINKQCKGFSTEEQNPNYQMKILAFVKKLKIKNDNGFIIN